MNARQQQTYFILSLIFHFFILFILILGFDSVSPLPVVENTNKNDVISAVILGDSPKFKILPKLKPVAQTDTQKEVIAIKKTEDKKKKAEEKLLAEIKQHHLVAKDLLADIKKQHDKQKKIKQKQLQSRFQKTLREQAEQSLRQQLLNEEIKLSSNQMRQSQGEINKYKALILQAISEHWIVPTQANKKLYCELMIRLAPGGVVLDAQVIKTSGDPSLDRSARDAVFKASPLPVPSTSNEFEAFRQFVLKVKPENIVSADINL